MYFGQKHLTAQSTQPESADKLNRYTFLEKASTQLDDHHRRSKCTHELPFPVERNGLFSIRFNNENTKLIAAFGNGTIEVLDAESGLVDYTVRSKQEEHLPIMCVRCVPGASDIFFAAAVSGQIYTCKFEIDSYTIFNEEKLNEINSIDIDCIGSTLISGGKDATVRLYDLQTAKLKHKMCKVGRDDDDHSTTHFHSMRIFAVKCHPTEDHIYLSGGWDDTVKIWDVRIKEGCVRNIQGPRICGDALDVKDRIILSGSWTTNNSLQLWDLGTSRLIENINPINRIQTIDGEFLYCCQFFKSERYDYVIAGGSGTSHLEIISVKDQKIVSSYKAHKIIQAIDSSHLSYIAYGGMDPSIKILHII